MAGASIDEEPWPVNLNRRPNQRECAVNASLAKQQPGY
jgi:hypothetical protein